MKLLKIRMENFKGYTDKTIEFGTVTLINGMNGTGKSTVRDAHFWLWVDKDGGLKSNPNIRPNDGRECIPTVTEICEIDGAEVTVSKMQKRTVGKPNDKGISKVTLTNTYEINGVPKTERDFRKDLTERRFDFDRFLPLSHPDVFTGQKAADMRKILFDMVESKSDQEVAEITNGCNDVAELLNTYKAEEIEAMNKASMKKAEEQIKAIPNQIIGLEKAKVDIDTAELELQRNSLKEQIADYDRKIADGSTELSKAQDGMIELQLEINGIYQKANDKLIAERRELQKQAGEAGNAFNEAERKHKVAQTDIGNLNKSIEQLKADKQQLVELWQIENEKEMQPFEDLPALDENSLICPTCGQGLPEVLKAQRIADYEKRKEQHRKDYEAAKNFMEQTKEKKLAGITQQGDATVTAITESKAAVSNLEKQIEQYKADKIRFNAEKTKAIEELSKLPEKPDVSNNQEYERLCGELNAKKQAIESMGQVDYTAQFKAKIEELREELSSVESEIAKSENNVRIDDQIESLRRQKLDYEQKKADAEKILYQLGLVSKAKNEMLSEEINSHFELVRWKLFDYRKNSEYVETCIPEVWDDKTETYKEIGNSANTGLEIRGKLDIIKGLQNFFEHNYPVFIDGAESLDYESKEKIKMDCQIIFLSVNENRELKVGTTS